MTECCIHVNTATKKEATGFCYSMTLGTEYNLAVFM